MNIKYKSGSARKDITPDHPVELCGYGDFLKRYFTGVHDPLYATAIVLDDGKNKAAILSADLISIEGYIVEKIRKRIKSYTGIPEENIMISCTHTHHGPATSFLRACGEIDPEYMEKIPELVSEPAIQASKSAKSLRKGLRIGRDSMEEVSYNRAGKPHLDREISALFGDSSTLWNFGCHPVVLERDNKLVSRDFPGSVADYMERAGYENVMFTNGACGDVDPIINKSRKAPGAPRPYPPSDFKDLDFYGKTIGDKLIELDLNSYELNPDISVNSKVIQLPLDKKRRMPGNHVLDPAREKRDSPFYKSWLEGIQKFLESGKFPDYLEAEIQSIKIGKDIFIAIPGEVMSETGLKIKQNHPNSVLVTYANGTVGYIPTKEDVLKAQEYGYVHGYKIYGFFPFSPDVEDALLDGVDSLFDDMKAKY